MLRGRWQRGGYSSSRTKRVRVISDTLRLPARYSRHMICSYSFMISRTKSVRPQNLSGLHILVDLHTRGGFAHTLAGSKMEDFCFPLKKPCMCAGPCVVLDILKITSIRPFLTIWDGSSRKTSAGAATEFLCFPVLTVGLQTAQFILQFPKQAPLFFGTEFSQLSCLLYKLSQSIVMLSVIVSTILSYPAAREKLSPTSLCFLVQK